MQRSFLLEDPIDRGADEGNGAKRQRRKALPFSQCRVRGAMCQVGIRATHYLCLVCAELRLGCNPLDYYQMLRGNLVLA